MKCSYAEHPKDTLSLLTELKKKQNRTEVIVQWGTACLAMVGLGFNPWYPKSLVSGSDPCPQTESGVSSKHYLNIISLWLHHHHQETKYIIMKKLFLFPDGMTMILENPRESINKLFKLGKEVGNHAKGIFLPIHWQKVIR